VPTDLGPDQLVKRFRTDTPLRTPLIIREEPASLTTVILMGGPVHGAQFLTGHRSPTDATAHQPPQQPTLLTEAPRTEAAIVAVDLQRAGKHGRIDEGRNGEDNPLLARPNTRVRPGFLAPAPSDRRETFLSPIVGEVTNVGLVVEEAVDGGDRPLGFSDRARDPLLRQPLCDHARRELFVDVPPKDLPHPHRGRLVDLDGRRDRPLTGDAPIAVGHAPEQRFALAQPKEAAAPIPFRNLGALIFGDDSLHLHEELRIGICRQRIVEELDRDPEAFQLLDDQDLVGVLAG
jgi:hypothetical protein